MKRVLAGVLAGLFVDSRINSRVSLARRFPMSRKMFQIRIFACLLITVTTVTSGCKKNRGRPGAATDSQTTPAREELTSLETQILSPFIWLASVNYRLIDGTPAPG